MPNRDYVAFTLQNAATSGNGSVGCLSGKYPNITFYTTFGTGASAGVVSYETAPTSDYTGTWAVLGTDSSASGAVKQSSFVGALAFVRARITTTIVGSTVTVEVRAT